MKSRGTEEIIKAISKLTGIKESTIHMHNSSPKNILERPNIINPTKNQLNKINALNDLIINYNITKYFSKEKAIKFNSIEDINNYFIKLLGRYKDKERFYVAFLDKNNQIINIKKMSEGTVNAAPVFPREIVKEIINSNSKSILICHNHPSGSTTPSDEDIKLSNNLKNIVEPLGIDLLDSIIVGEESYKSLRQIGKLDVPNNEDKFINDTLDKNSGAKIIYNKHLNSFINRLSELTGVSEDKLIKIAETEDIKYDENINNTNRILLVLERADALSGILKLTDVQAKKIKSLVEILKNQDLINSDSMDSITVTNPHLLDQDDLKKKLLDGIEGIMAIYLDTKLNIISMEEISEVNKISNNLELEPKTLLINTLAHEASSILIVNKINNQNINSVAFQGEEIAQRLFNIFDPLRIRVLDYIIVEQREERTISLKEKGLMPYSQFGMADYSKIEIKQFYGNEYDEEHYLEDFELEELDSYELEW